ncbi:MAG: GNAT family N-acetyltransferase [Candidatus Omnitrophica bacterium]|nr:GNAT family N-acetyltransferase [Candidatus Omnitrophota bacterium]MDD5352651.1 GNAT family N-acetyltransferase [Candidatus Omnitrophota bacterium]MDD5550250.1 GNAT family N-acetyltransferase [Candidatus Omnitrophota bacterium]
MRVQIITDYNEFKKLEQIWNEVLNRSNNNVFFLRHEWLSIWWEFCGDGHELFIILVWDSEELIAIAPLTVEKRKIMPILSLKSLKFIAHGVSDYLDFIITKNSDACFKIIFEQILDCREKWDCIDLFYIRGDSSNFRLFQKYVKEYKALSGSIKAVDSSVVINLEEYSDWFDYFGKMDKKYRSDINRQENRLNKLGNLIFDRVKTYNEGIEILSSFVKSHEKRWGAVFQRSQFSDSQSIERYSRLLEVLTNKNLLDFSYLKLNAIPIAFHFGYIYNKQFYYYTPTFNPEYSIFSPGKIMLKYLINKSFSERLRYFDLLRGTEEYKMIWPNKLINLYQFRLFKTNLSGIILFGIFQIFNVFKKLLISVANISFGRKLLIIKRKILWKTKIEN